MGAQSVCRFIGANLSAAKKVQVRVSCALRAVAVVELIRIPEFFTSLSVQIFCGAGEIIINLDKGKQWWRVAWQATWRPQKHQQWSPNNSIIFTSEIFKQFYQV